MWYTKKNAKLQKAKVVLNIRCDSRFWREYLHETWRQNAHYPELSKMSEVDIILQFSAYT